jgi:hypothetical protein
MAFLDTLLVASEIPEAAYIKFLQQYKFHEKTIHIFLEGDDDQSFYVNYIENIVEEDFRVFYYVWVV